MVFFHQSRLKFQGDFHQSRFQLHGVLYNLRVYIHTDFSSIPLPCTRQYCLQFHFHLHGDFFINTASDDIVIFSSIQLNNIGIISHLAYLYRQPMPPLLTARAAVQLAQLLMAGADGTAGALFSHTGQYGIIYHFQSRTRQPPGHNTYRSRDAYRPCLSAIELKQMLDSFLSFEIKCNINFMHGDFKLFLVECMHFEE